MKQEITISRKVKILTYSVFILIVLVFGILTTNNWNIHQKRLSIFTIQKVNSKIYRLKDLNRGSQEFVFSYNNQLDSVSLPMTFEVKKYNIKVGDSICKEANSRQIMIFRTENLNSIKMCETEF